MPLVVRMPLLLVPSDPKVVVLARSVAAARCLLAAAAASFSSPTALAATMEEF